MSIQIIQRIYQGPDHRGRLFEGPGYPYNCSGKVSETITSFFARESADEMGAIMLRFHSEIIWCNGQVYSKLREPDRHNKGLPWGTIEPQLKSIPFAEPLAWLGKPNFLIFRPYVMGEWSIDSFSSGLVCLKTEAEEILAKYLRSALSPAQHEPE